MGTKERILDAALDLFAEEGVAGTTITAIERRAGLAGGTGSLYRHFGSKDEVLEATLTREVERVKAAAARDRADLPRLPDRRSQLTLEFHQCLNDIRRFDRLLRILRSDPIRRAAVPGVVNKVLGLDRGLSAWPEGETTADPQGLDPLTSAMVIASLVGYHSLSLFGDKPYLGLEPEEFIARLVDLVANDGLNGTVSNRSGDAQRSPRATTRTKQIRQAT